MFPPSNRLLATTDFPTDNTISYGIAQLSLASWHYGTVKPEPTICHIATVERQIGDSMLIVVPGSRNVRVLGPTAAIVWRGLDTACDREWLVAMLGQVYPDIPVEDRARAVQEILQTLESDGLVSLG
jgi:hypothetical protein